MYKQIIGLLIISILAGCSSGGGGNNNNNNNNNPDDNGGSGSSTGQPSWHIVATGPSSPGQLSVWAASDSSVYGGDRDGRLFHYDGTHWNLMDTQVEGSVTYLWGLADDEVYASGGTLGVMRYDGEVWSQVPGAPTGVATWGIWGTAEDDLFVAGNGEIYHYDGVLWETATVGGGTIWEIWGTASDDVFAAGNGGYIHHYDGNSWSLMNSGTSSNIWELWGISSDNVYAMTDYQLLHYDGIQWSPVTVDVPNVVFNRFNSVWARDANHVYVATDTSLLMFNGTNWEKVSDTASANLSGSETKVFASGSREIGVYDTGNYKTLLFETYEQVQTISGSAADSVFIGGLWSYGMYYDGESWNWIPKGTNPGLYHFYYSWVFDENNIFAGDYENLNHFDGVLWNRYGSGESWGIWAESMNNIYLAGNSGRVLVFDFDTGLTEFTTPTTNNLKDIWGFSNDDIYAVGYRVIMHFDGSEWTQKTFSLLSLNAVWGSGPQDVYVAGGLGRILHYDGTDWVAMALDQFPYHTFNDIWGSGPDDVYIAGSKGLVHFDGVEWQMVEAMSDRDLKKIWGTGPDNIYVLDRFGNIFQYAK